MMTSTPPTDTGDAAGPLDFDPEQLARRFHKLYEGLAPHYGYETRPETREFDPGSPNGQLMIAVCARLLNTHPDTPSPAPEGLADERAVMVCPQCEGEGGYADGLDEAACHTECTRCGSNGWIVDLAALRSQPADDRGLQWQPIETAPKDGTRILVWATTRPPHYDDQPYVESILKGQHVEQVQPAAWLEEYGEWEQHFIGTPLFWMPLPDAPRIDTELSKTTIPVLKGEDSVGEGR